jgi:hypothetical protein
MTNAVGSDASDLKDAPFWAADLRPCDVKKETLTVIEDVTKLQVH